LHSRLPGRVGGDITDGLSAYRDMHRLATFSFALRVEYPECQVPDCHAVCSDTYFSGSRVKGQSANAWNWFKMQRPFLCVTVQGNLDTVITRRRLSGDAYRSGTIIIGGHRLHGAVDADCHLLVDHRFAVRRGHRDVDCHRHTVGFWINSR